MTELSFLLELFLDPDLPCSMRDKLVARIREVETILTTRNSPPATNQIQNMPPKLQQAPSTLAAMARHGDIPNTPGGLVDVIPSAPTPVILSGEEVAARQRSMEILKGKKQQHLTR